MRNGSEPTFLRSNRVGDGKHLYHSLQASRLSRKRMHEFTSDLLSENLPVRFPFLFISKNKDGGAAVQ